MILHVTMNLDQQIKTFEECITRLEQCRRNGFGDTERIKLELDKAYEQMAVLRIRKMMGS